MTESPNQQFFLEQFQGLLHQIAEGDTADTLGVLVDVREAGFTNKELDTHINRLREAPAQAIPGLVTWLELIVDRLMAFQGDFLQLVGEFSEAEVGLSEAEWSVAEADKSVQEAVDFDGFDAFDGFDDLEDIESFGEFEDADFDFDLDLPVAGGGVEVVDVDVDAIEDDEGMDALFDELEDFDSPEPIDTNEPDSIDFALIESSVAIDMPDDGESLFDEDDLFDEDEPLDEDDLFDEEDLFEGKDREAAPFESGIEAAIGATTQFPPADGHQGFEGGDFDFPEFLDSSSAAQRPAQSDETFELAEPEQGSAEDVWADVDVAPDKPIVEEPAMSDEDDDFDFDFGFENPEEKNKALNQAFEDQDTRLFDVASTADAGAEAKPQEDVWESGFSASSAPQESGGWGEGFDFGFDEDSVGGFEDAGLDTASSHTPTPGAAERPGSASVTAQHDALDAPSRELEITPPSMPAIPRFGTSGEPTSPRIKVDEPTSPGTDKADMEELRTRASLDDDEFFELAESLAGESSVEQNAAWDKPKKNRYRGEPMMVEPPRERTPTPRAIYEVAQSPAPREREHTPNPFANQEPTGVREPLISSNSSFVLEEISSSEAHEKEAAVDTLMDEARRLFEAGEYESARDFLSALMARDDVSEAAHTLGAKVDAKLEAIHQAKLGPLDNTPRLNIEMGEIASMTLDHRFGFLLSQIDGMSSFEDILELSSMSRLETLDVLAQMLKREIICVG